MTKPHKLKNPTTLGKLAYQILHESVKKFTKPENQIFKDTDPEDIHHMRVGTRRLRTALQVFEAVVVLPKPVSGKRVRAIAQALGAVRDLDVLQLALAERYYPQLPEVEKTQLLAWGTTLQTQRQIAFAKLVKTLHSRRYQKLKHALQDWLASPELTPLADLPLKAVLPDVMLPLLSQLFLHPGWLVGRSLLPEQVSELNGEGREFDPWQVAALLEQEGTALHDLRKQMKQVRYQTEFLVPFYGPDYAAWLQQVKAVQELLGQLQDIGVLRECLGTTFPPQWTVIFPTLAQQLQTLQTQSWRQWQPLQAQFLDPAFRDSLRSLLLTPQLEQPTAISELV